MRYWPLTIILIPLLGLLANCGGGDAGLPLNGTAVKVERLDDSKIDYVARIYIVTIPTGERILITASDSKTTTILLPPAPPVKVEAQ